ncbi:MAG: sugar ABC transporter substrate-binding protein [Spirochaetales bacterium]|nr:sugar ABC transporter substrate-binding protein [Spirochaetales bacterium]
MKKQIFTILLAACLVLTLWSNGKEDKTSGPVTVQYILWDANQLPAYEKCAEDFMAANPDITIEITQMGWGDYWTGLQTDMVGGTAADVFTNHLAKYPDFASKGQLVDIAPMVARDKVDTSVYMNGLDGLWATKDGKRFGLPKDWDTIAIVYNQEMINAAGYSAAEANSLNWNAKDGGTFEKFIAALSVDTSGRNGLDPNFDSENVACYGLALNHFDDRGQAQFSPMAVSNNWMYTDGLYNANYHFDDPKFIATIQWFVDMTEKGFLAPYEMTANNANPLFTSRQAATVFDGSWMIGYYSSSSEFPVGFAKLPAGPAGVKSMTNGLADSIWVGSKHKEQAWLWVKYLASAEAQNTVGTFGVVFPAIESGVKNALAAYDAKGLDVSAFTEEATNPGETFVYPIVDNGVKISEIMTQTFDSIFLGVTDAESSLKEANKKILDLF